VAHPSKPSLVSWDWFSVESEIRDLPLSRESANGQRKLGARRLSLVRDLLRPHGGVVVEIIPRDCSHRQVEGVCREACLRALSLPVWSTTRAWCERSFSQPLAAAIPSLGSTPLAMTRAVYHPRPAGAPQFTCRSASSLAGILEGDNASSTVLPDEAAARQVWSTLCRDE